MRSFKKTLLLGGLLLTSLWGIYWVSIGLPVVPSTGAALVAGTLFSETRHTRLSGGAGDNAAFITVVAMCLAAVVLTSMFIGMSSSTFATKGGIGWLLGILLLWSVTTARAEARRVLAGAIAVILLVHISVWLVQYVVVHTTGTYLDIGGTVADDASRHETYAYGLGIRTKLERCTGLFAEPAHYCLFVYLCVAARMIHRNRLDLLDWIGLGTMLASLALSGAILSIAVLAVFLLSWAKSARSLALACAGAVAVYGPVIYGLASTYFVERANNMDRDSSFHGRFSMGWEYYLQQTDALTLLFGKGIGAYPDRLARGSGILDLLIYLGFLGTLLFVGLLALIAATHRIKWQGAVLLLVSLGSIPLQTSPFWWIWVGLVIARQKEVV